MAPATLAKVSQARRRHILDGDGTGGGHRHGTGAKGKTAFPARWSDDKVIAAIESVANDPTSLRRVRWNGRIEIHGTRHGVDIRVIIDKDGFRMGRRRLL